MSPGGAIEAQGAARPGYGRLLEARLKDLSCAHGFVLHGGEEEYPMGRGVHAVPARLVASPDRLCQALRLPLAAAPEPPECSDVPTFVIVSEV